MSITGSSYLALEIIVKRVHFISIPDKPDGGDEVDSNASTMGTSA